MRKRSIETPKFKNESEEADWWASAEGRNYLKRKSQAAQASGIKPRGSSLLATGGQEEKDPDRYHLK